jgi:PD-(D/E)XK nuclease superfamily
MRKPGKQERRKVALEHEALTERIIGAAIEVHRCLGPGFLESVYEKALIIELKKR